MNLEYNSNRNTWDSDGEFGQNKWYQCSGRRKIMAIAVASLGFAICVCFLAFMVYSENPESQKNTKKTLKFASIIFRHGARTPTSTYNSDPHKNYNWPGGLGSLTNEGKLQLYNLGKLLRNEYMGFLPEEYQESDIYIYSSDSPRTISSAYTLLAGLYPPTPEQRWHPSIMWQPIPVHTIPRLLDKTLAIKKPCKESAVEYAAVKRLPEIVDKYQELFNNLTVHANQSIQDTLAVEMMYSTLLIEDQNNLKLPDWTKEYFPDKLREATCTSFDTFTYNAVLKRFNGGPLLGEILTNMDKKQNGKLRPDRKMFLYSAHDLTIVSLWRTLGFEDCLLPDYGAALIVEMHSIPGNFDSEIKLLYHNNTEAKPHELRVPNCGRPCTLTSFINITSDLIPIDWEAECKNSYH